MNNSRSDIGIPRVVTVEPARPNIAKGFTAGVLIIDEYKLEMHITITYEHLEE